MVLKKHEIKEEDDSICVLPRTIVVELEGDLGDCLSLFPLPLYTILLLLINISSTNIHIFVKSKVWKLLN
jgi:hypothetical protein